jgi:uncharacterized glyoxalase superfamily metalloenzyme YdcJ
LTDAEADEFVTEALETFRWHSEATVDAATYDRLHKAHRLIADVVSFRGPHINHLTPRTLDIDEVQAGMPGRGIIPKAVIEGPPQRRCPILLRQTSFKALEEAIAFPNADGAAEGTHTARFGEIEQRGVALTPKGRELYDRLLASVREEGGAGNANSDYAASLRSAFQAFPDDLAEIRLKGLGYFLYGVAAAEVPSNMRSRPLDELVASGYVTTAPIVYEDFLPVSAAGIFQSNLGGAEQRSYAAQSNRSAFVEALGSDVLDEFALYTAMEAASIAVVNAFLSQAA